ncbi:MAG: hypothetical protein OEY23_16490 [Acidimicrobiia bacterium]|nr:hypothetical protein [Acidimicrobiia bacterium]
MTTSEPELDIRPEIDAAQRAVLARWASPGAWWTGAERLGIVAETRRALAASDVPPPWVAASTLARPAPAVASLPAAAVDVVWRLTHHPGTLTADWYASVIDRGLGPGPYTELVGLVAQVNCVDRFAEALGLAPLDLPEPVSGEPNRAVPDEVAVRRHWVPTAPVKGPNVLRALSAVPFENESRAMLSDAQYVPAAALLGDLESGRGALTRPQIELVAARTSVRNECFY